MNSHDYERPRLTSRGRGVKRWITRNWPFLLWLAVIVFITAFYSRNQRFGQMTGTVEVIGEEIVPQETARLVSVNVVVGQRVARGDVLAQMDTSLIDAQLGVDEATLRDARDTFAQYQRSMVASINQAETAIHDADSAIKTAQMRQQSGAAQVAVLSRELKRREDLLAKRLIDEMAVSELRPQIAALEQDLEAYPKLIEINQQARASALKNHEALQACLRLDPSGNLSAAISNKTESSLAIVEATREKSLLRKKSSTLRANRDGTVSRLYIQPGNMVPAGTPVMHIVEEHPSTVIGFLPETGPVAFKAGQEVFVWRLGEEVSWALGTRRWVVPAVVQSVSPAVEALPVRINPVQVQIQGGVPLRGRRIIFKFKMNPGAAGAVFIPGESVEIREVHQGWLRFIDRLEQLIGGYTVAGVDQPACGTQVASMGSHR